MKTNLIENRQIRIFISSTFRDMQAERDHLVQVVFPGLRRYCEERDVTLQEIDLRWGISEAESKQGKVVDICLKSIENTHPFFIGLLGERYGWVPNEEERRNIENTGVFEDEKYPEVKDMLRNGTSITEIEIQEGVLRSKEKVYAYFYFRSPKMEVPDDFKEPADSLGAKKLRRLKLLLHVQQTYPDKDYESIKHLGRLVEADFKALVDRLFPQGVFASELERERFEQGVFLRRMTAVYVPIHEYEACINEFVQSDGRGLVICGESGSGKSALLANWIKNRGKRENEKVIYHFIGQSRAQDDSQHITSRLINEIRDLYDGLPAPPTAPSSSLEVVFDSKQKVELEQLLFAIQDRGRLVIILDGVDKLPDIDKDFHWFPAFPAAVKIIFSTEEDNTWGYFDSIGCQTVDIGPLGKEYRKNLIEAYLLSFGKKLTPPQIERIASDDESKNPLVLCTVLDELRVFGKHEELDNEIDKYLKPDTIPGLFALALERREKIFNYEGKDDFVQAVLSLLYVSRSGLCEAEILALTGAKQLYWSQFLNGTASHLIEKGGLITFSNSFIRDVVKQRYLPDDAAERAYREKIVDFIKGPAVSRNRRYDELPHQLYALAEWDALYRFLLDFDVLNYLLKDNSTFIKYWHELYHINPEKYAIERCLEIDVQGRDPAEVWRMFHRMSYLAYAIAGKSIALARTFVEKAVMITEESYGVNNIETAKCYTFVSDTYSVIDQQKRRDCLLKALAIYRDQLGEEHADTAKAYCRAGESYMQGSTDRLNSAKEALPYLQKAITIQEKLLGSDHPDTAYSYVKLAGIYMILSMNDDENCRIDMEYQKAGMEHLTKVVSSVEKAYGRNSFETEQTYLALAMGYLLMSDNEKAVDYAARAKEISKNISVFMDDSLSEAVSALSEMISDFIPNDDASNAAETYFNSGLMAIMREDYDQAMVNFTKAIDLNPKYDDAYVNRGTIYLNKENYDRAIEDYTTAIALNPNEADVYHGRGNAYFKKDDYDKAIGDYEKAVNIDHDNDEYRISLALAYYFRGDEYFENGDCNRAIADFERAVQFDPDDDDYREKLAEAKTAKETAGEGSPQ